jgi:hypothetical protein
MNSSSSLVATQHSATAFCLMFSERSANGKEFQKTEFVGLSKIIQPDSAPAISATTVRRKKRQRIILKGIVL